MSAANNPGGRKGKGKGVRFLRALLGHTGTECVQWPYTRDLQGRGVLGYLGSMWQAHRLMCILAHGEPPSPVHHAAHSCGNGHEACVNPNHLVWKTPEQNAQDMVVHGTARKPGGAKRKLTAPQVERIKAMKGTATQREIAVQFGVAWETIADIHRGRTWAGPTKEFTIASPQERLHRSREAARMRLEGKTYSEIGRALGVSRVMAREYAREDCTQRGGN